MTSARSTSTSSTTTRTRPSARSPSRPERRSSMRVNGEGRSMSRISRLLGSKPDAGKHGAGAAGKTSGPAPLLSSLGMSSSLFADASNFDQRFIEDYDQIETTVNALRTLGFKFMPPGGSFGLTQEGHSISL